MARRYLSNYEDRPYTEKATSPVYEETSVPPPKNGIVANASCVKLRGVPTLTGDVLRYLDNGDQVEILERLSNFYRVRVNGIVGYISSKFCKEVD